MRVLVKQLETAPARRVVVSQGVGTDPKYDSAPIFLPSGSTAASGAVPAPPTTAGTSKFLCEDGTWKIASTAAIQKIHVQLETNATSNTSSWVDLLTTGSFTTGAHSIDVIFMFSITNQSSGACDFRVLVDGIAIRGCGEATNASYSTSGGCSFRTVVTAGSHIVKVQWYRGSGTVRCRPLTTTDESASMWIEEVIV